MKKIGLLMIIVTILLILDNSVMPFFSVNCAYPSLIFVFVISYSLNRGYGEAIALGIFSGFLEDIYFSNGIGINMLANMLTCVLAVYIGSLIMREKKLIPVIIVFFLTLIKGILIFVILYIAKIYFSFSQVLFAGLYNLIIGLLFYKVIYNFSQKDIINSDWQ